MSSSVLQHEVPHSVIFPTQSLYLLSFRVFGCTCFAHDITPSHPKLSAKVVKCIFLGYSRLQKGYQCYSPDHQCYFISIDVTFFEASPFFLSSPVEGRPVSEIIPTPYLCSPSFDTAPTNVPFRFIIVVHILLQLLTKNLITHLVLRHLHLPRTSQ